MINRVQFVKYARASLKFNSQASFTLYAILDEWEGRGLTDQRWLAYICSTVLGECGPNMLPVREGFKKTDDEARTFVKRQGYKYAKEVNGHVYYGRGLVQLTWDSNYRDMTKLLGIDLYNNPDLALRPDVAVKIMFEGIIRGSFSGKKLSDYFNARKDDPVNARRIINGTDKAAKFAGFHKKFLSAIQASATAAPGSSLASVIEDRRPPAPTPETAPAPNVEPRVKAARPAFPVLCDPATLPAFVKAWDEATAEADPETFLVQWRLKAMSYNPGGLDGRWGGMTAGAITGFNNDRGRVVAPKIDAAFSAALEKAEIEGFKRPIAEERANIAPEQLEEKAPEIKPIKRNMFWTMWGAVSAFFMSIISTVSDYLVKGWDFVVGNKDKLPDDPLSYVGKAFELLGKVPGAVWLVLVAVALALIGLNSRRGVKGIEKSVQTGERP